MHSLVSIPAKIDEPDHVVRAEAGGISHFGVGEGPLLWSDPYSNPMTFSRDSEDLSELVAVRV